MFKRKTEKKDSLGVEIEPKAWVLHTRVSEREKEREKAGKSIRVRASKALVIRIELDSERTSALPETQSHSVRLFKQRR